MERTWPPETVSSSLSASLSLSSLTLQTLSCCFHLWRHAERQNFSLFWLVESAASLPLQSGWKDTIHLHWDSTDLKFGCWHGFHIPWKLKSVDHQQRINTSCLCVFQYYCLIVFFKWFCDCLCIFVSDQKRSLVFFSKTSTVSQWKPLCLVGILFVWCNIHPALIWLVGWSVDFCVRQEAKESTVLMKKWTFFSFIYPFLCMFWWNADYGCILFLCLCFRCQSLNYCGQKYFLIKLLFFLHRLWFRASLSEASMALNFLWFWWG